MDFPIAAGPLVYRNHRCHSLSQVRALRGSCVHLLWGTSCQPPQVFSWLLSLWHGAPGSNVPTPCSKTLQSTEKWGPKPFMAPSWGTGQLLVSFTSSIPTWRLTPPANKHPSIKPGTCTGQTEAVGLSVTTTLGTTFVRKTPSNSNFCVYFSMGVGGRAPDRNGGTPFTALRRARSRGSPPEPEGPGGCATSPAGGRRAGARPLHSLPLLLPSLPSGPPLAAPVPGVRRGRGPGAGRCRQRRAAAGGSAPLGSALLRSAPLRSAPQRPAPPRRGPCRSQDAAGRAPSEEWRGQAGQATGGGGGGGGSPRRCPRLRAVHGAVAEPPQPLRLLRGPGHLFPLHEQLRRGGRG